MRESFIKELEILAEKDKSIMLLTGDLGFGVFENFEKKFPYQYLNAGITEQAMTSMASGLALEGKKVFTYSIGNFSTLRCLEQIRNDAAYHEANVNIVSMGGGFSYGQLGMSHHATEDLSILRSLPNLSVYAPCSSFETSMIMKEISSTKSVNYLRLDKSEVNEPIGSEEEFVLGQMRLFSSGEDVTFIASGGILNEVMDASKDLLKHDISSKVLSCHSIKPIDSNSIIKAALETKVIVTVEENNLFGGLGSAVAEVLMDRMIYPKKFLRISIPDVYSSIVGDQSYLRKYYKISADDIFQRTFSLLRD